MSSSQLTPKKLKDHLTALRESISSLGENVAVTSGFALLLTIELSSRGIHCTLPSNILDIANEEFISLLDVVHNTAGKSPIGDGEYPSQLLAALWAAGGMAASACINTSNNINNSVKDAIDKTMKRCREVNDGRFYTLLELCSTSTGTERETALNNVAYANYLFGAEKYAVDQVPMWKRCLDCVLSGTAAENHGSYMNSQTILPLKNMMRIAQSKQNVKRAEELRVWLVCGYIGAMRERLALDENERKKEQDIAKFSTAELVDTFFLRRSVTFVELEKMEFNTLIKAARQNLIYPQEGQEESKLLYQYLSAQIQYLSEEIKVVQEVRSQIKSRKNRLPEKDVKAGVKAGKGKDVKVSPAPIATAAVTVTAAEKEEMERQTRHNVLLEAWDDWIDSPRELNDLAVVGLRNAIIASCPSTLTSLTSLDLVHDCHAALKCQVQRLLDIAVALQRKRGGKKGKESVSCDDLRMCWRTLLSFVAPLVTSYLSEVIKLFGDKTAPMEDSLRSLLECVGESVVSAAWMCEPLRSKYIDKGSSRDEEFSNIVELLAMTNRCLLLCKQERSEEKQRPVDAQKKSAFSSSDDDLEKRELMMLDCALSATQIRMDLNGLLGTNDYDADTSTKELSVDSLTSIAHKATIAATISAKSCADTKMPSLSPAPIYAKFGALFLQFLSAWSGLYINPWPFCNVGQARSIIRNARDSLQQAGKVWGRETGFCVENVVLDIAEADFEGGLTGGFVQNAKGLYKQSLQKIASDDGSLGVSRAGMRLLHTHCLVGLARISDSTQSEQYARDALLYLNKSEKEESEFGNRTLVCLYAWDDVLLSNFARSYHECTSRQLVAEALIRSSRLEEARTYLYDAVKAAPSNFDALFSLASFHLRSLLFHSSEMDGIEKVETRNLLLKSAKLNKTQPSPFALLGVFYESQSDVARAIGCYRKAASIDPSNPVSGRGLQRLVSMEEMKPFCEAATEQNSPLNGWAWRSIGQLQSWKDGNYTSAVICFQQALRCKDIQYPEREVLGAFYSDPKLSYDGQHVMCPEAGETWAELASCYRQLGKWSGSFRAYHAAYAVSGGNLSSDSLVAWAQVELELGLFEDAVQRCNEALLLSKNPQIQKLASFVKGKAILSISRQDIQEGKYGSSLSHIKSGLEFQGDSYCELKLLGDLCSVSEALPPYVFVEDFAYSNAEMFEYETSVEVKRKLSLLAAGAASYFKALELVKQGSVDDDDKSFLITAAATDLGNNFLAQARTISQALGDGSGGGSLTSMPDLMRQHVQLQNIVKEAINAFMCAIDCSPGDAHAWCGLGCAIAATGDPLKAQHSFSRALQLDKANAEAWSNIGVLFTDFDLREKGSEILDALTQAEDTPFMWICRGFLFEKASDVWQGQVSSREGNLAKAADSFRAALQIFQHPSALLGLSLTCRRNYFESLGASDALYSMLASESSQAESLLSVTVHQNIADNGDHLASCLNSVTHIEKDLDLITSRDGETGDDVMQRIKTTVESVKKRIDLINERDGIMTSPPSGLVQCEIDCDVSLPVKAKNTGKIPFEAIQKNLDTVMSVTSLGTADCRPLQKQPSMDDARNLLFLNPGSGEEWLAFAKVLSRDLCNMENADSNEKNQALDSARVAASRAYEILHDSVVHASMVSPTARFATQGISVDRSETPVVSRVASASIVSEAISLAVLLNKNEIVCATQTKVEENASTNAMATMEEAFLLDPMNVTAGKALGCL